MSALRWKGFVAGLLAALGCAGEGEVVMPPPPPPGVGGIELSYTEAALPVGGAVQLTGRVVDENGNPVAGATVTWSSSNSGVASVDANGNVAAVAVGSATITATSGAVSEDAVVDVVASAAYGADVQPIFSASCALSGCHVAGHNTGLDLTAANSYGLLVNVPSAELASMDRVEPNEPLLSYLVHKIRGTQNSVGGSGSQMPLIGGPLSADEINTIRAWIQVGAANN